MLSPGRNRRLWAQLHSGDADSLQDSTQLWCVNILLSFFFSSNHIFSCTSLDCIIHTSMVVIEWTNEWMLWHSSIFTSKLQMCCVSLWYLVMLKWIERARGSASSEIMHCQSQPFSAAKSGFEHKTYFSVSMTESAARYTITASLFAPHSGVSRIWLPK